MNKLESSYYRNVSMELFGSAERTLGTADLDQSAVSYSQCIKSAFKATQLHIPPRQLTVRVVSISHFSGLLIVCFLIAFVMSIWRLIHSLQRLVSITNLMHNSFIL
jgi:hypothetical protein